MRQVAMSNKPLVALPFGQFPLPAKPLPWIVLLFCWCCWHPSIALAADNLEIHISGVEGDLLQNIRSYLSIVRENEAQKKKLSKQTIQNLYRLAPDEIRRALQPFGYYQPDIESRLKQKNGVWQVRYKINPGPPTKIRKVEIRLEGPGRNEPKIRQALKSVNITKGQRLQQQKYTQLKQNLMNAAYDTGYIDAKYQRSEILVRPNEQSAEIYLILNTGPRYYFGKITIEQDILDPAFVAKFVHIKRGDPFVSQRLLNLQFALIDSDYFSNVEMEADRNKAVNYHIPITARTIPSKPQKYLVSLGYGTDTGPRLRLGVLFRRVTRTGHEFRTDLELSLIKRSLSSQYKIPIGNVASEFADITAGVQNANIGDATVMQYVAGSSLNQDWLGGRRRISLQYKREYFSFGSGPTHVSNLVIPGISYARKVADNPLFTRKGYSASVDLHGGVQKLLSDTNFLQIKLSGRAVLPWAKRGRLLLRADYGATATNGFDRLPPSERFFAGGARSVRGYAYQSISPENAEGKDIGGRYLLVGSIETDYLLIGNFGAAVFFDAGNATRSPSLSLRKGAGIGLRYRSPVGMVRLDFAHPFDDRVPVRIHISIGPDL